MKMPDEAPKVEDDSEPRLSDISGEPIDLFVQFFEAKVPNDLPEMVNADGPVF